MQELVSNFTLKYTDSGEQFFSCLGCYTTLQYTGILVNVQKLQKSEIHIRETGERGMEEFYLKYNS